MTQHPAIKLLLSIVAITIVVLGAYMLFLDLRVRPIAFLSVAFHAVFPLAAFFLWQLARGTIRQGPAITLLCVAGAVGVGGAFGYLASGRPARFIFQHWPTLGAGAIAGLLTLVASLEVLLRKPRETLPRVAWGMAFLIPLLALTLLLLRGTIGRAIATVPDAAGFGLWILLLLAFIALTSGAGHHLIRAFQIGVAAFNEPDQRLLVPGPQASPTPPAPPAPPPATPPAAQA
jgi:hypothetical protein